MGDINSKFKVLYPNISQFGQFFSQESCISSLYLTTLTYILRIVSLYPAVQTFFLKIDLNRYKFAVILSKLRDINNYIFFLLKMIVRTHFQYVIHCRSCCRHWTSSVKSTNNNKHLLKDTSSPVECVFQKTHTHTHTCIYPQSASIVNDIYTVVWETDIIQTQEDRTGADKWAAVERRCFSLHGKTRCICRCVWADSGALAFSMSIINCNSVKEVTDWRRRAVHFSSELSLSLCSRSLVCYLRFDPLVLKMKYDWGGWFRLWCCSWVFIKTDGQYMFTDINTDTLVFLCCYCHANCWECYIST